MNFEQLSEQYKAIKSPGIQLTGSGSDNTREGFMKYLENEEAETKQRYYRMYILYGIGSIAYFALYIFNPDTDLTLSNRLAGVCFFIAFAILVIVSRKRYSEMKRASFLNSPLQFLQDARRRHIFWDKRLLGLIPVILLVNIGATLSVLKYFAAVQIVTAILLIQLIYWSIMILGFYRGKKVWTKKKKPILLKIDEMLAGFEEH